jgi:FMN phosphatase YigB (HAD superfamily)
MKIRKENSEFKKIKQKSSELKRIRNRITLSGDWWDGKTHVLLDMDGTLINQPGALFHNLFALGVLFRMRSLGSFSKLIKAAQKTKEILLSSHSFKSNEEAFFETLSSELNANRKKIERFIAKFFDSDYPFICLFLHSDPNARKLVDLLHASNRHITLATNPVFGRREIELRLKASDLYLHDFDLVTSWDVMKSTKPHTQFFNDTLNKIGAAPERTIMIGNDPYYDLPAHILGIQTLLVGNKLTLKDIVESLEENMNTIKV